MSREAARVKRIERFDIREKLIELGINLQACPAIVVERICQAVQGENQTLRALTEQLIRGSVRGEFRVQGCQGDQQGSRGTVAPVGGRGAARESIRLRLHAGEIRFAGSVVGWLTGDGMFPADVAVAQSQASPFQRATVNGSICGSPASAQLISRSATACPVSHWRSPFHGSSSANASVRRPTGCRVRRTGRDDPPSSRIRPKILVAGHTSVCPHINVAEITHAGSNASVVGPVGAGVTPQPVPRRAVARLARNPFVGMRSAGKPAGSDDWNGE